MKMRKKTKEFVSSFTIIEKELEIWKTGYPKNKKLLEDFARKIRLELMLQGGIK